MVYKCTAILHTPMGRTHGENSKYKLDNDAKRVANTYGITLFATGGHRSFSYSAMVDTLQDAAESN